MFVCFLWQINWASLGNEYKVWGKVEFCEHQWQTKLKITKWNTECTNSSVCLPIRNWKLGSCQWMFTINDFRLLYMMFLHELTTEEKLRHYICDRLQKKKKMFLINWTLLLKADFKNWSHAKGFLFPSDSLTLKCHYDETKTHKLIQMCLNSLCLPSETSRKMG